jgi:hypothetical protein
MSQTRRLAAILAGDVRMSAFNACASPAGQIGNGRKPPFSATQPSRWEWLLLPLKRPCAVASQPSWLVCGPSRSARLIHAARSPVVQKETAEQGEPAAEHGAAVCLWKR